MSASIAAWAVSATAFMKPYAPASWVFAALSGGLLFAPVPALVAYSRDRWVRTTLLRRFHENADRINPLEAMFTQRRIRIEDLASPIDRTVRGKTFIDCEILGPANIFFLATKPGSGAITGCDIIDCAGARFKDGVMVPNAIILVDCNVLRCRLHRLIIIAPVSAYSALKSNLIGLQWLTLDPTEDDAARQQAFNQS